MVIRFHKNSTFERWQADQNGDLQENPSEKSRLKESQKFIQIISR